MTISYHKGPVSSAPKPIPTVVHVTTEEEMALHGVTVPGWFWYDETWAISEVYPTEKDATAAQDAYCKEML